ncbi:MAG TPA: YXWGXW repeat-containing protein [Kofleriaceae bacterium]|nr:YXWGXW repeat-containing protein [Kofleriaceae bacterium]
MPIILASVVITTACASHIRTEVIGRGTAGIQVRDGRAGLAATSVAVTAGSYAIAMTFDLPRAQRVDWTVHCPGADAHGTLGERFDAYRARRIAEIADERQREANVTSSIANAVVGGPAVHVRVRTDGIELPPGDVGAGRVTDGARIDVSGDGACSITAVTDDANVAGGYSVTRVRDLDAEEPSRAMAEQDAAAHARILVTARLVLDGADANAREARSAAVIAERMHVEAGLVACGADPERRSQLVAMGEARAKAEVDLAMRVRGQLRGQLVAAGAIERTPMPEAIVETHAGAPFAGAVWMPGAWTWSGARWSWTKGTWRDDRPVVVRKRRVVIHRPVVIVPVPVPR